MNANIEELFCLNSNVINPFLNAIIMENTYFHKNEYDLKSHLAKLLLAYSFINRFENAFFLL